MAGLILKLRPFETVLVNGAHIENGDRKAKLCIKTENARVLRLKDALRPEEATTPLKKAYYVAQMAVLGEIDSHEALAILERAIIALGAESTRSNEMDTRLSLASDALATGRFYSVMRELGAAMKAADGTT